jgi:hypothetical protein
MRKSMRPAVAAVAGIVLGAVVTISMQGGAIAPDGRAHRNSRDPIAPFPATFLAWVPRGLPAGFAEAVRALPETGPVTTVAEDHAWLTRSWDADGLIVDRTSMPYRIPLDTIAVDPASFAVFLDPADRHVEGGLHDGRGVLSATSATLRGLGPGASLRFSGGHIVTIEAVLPDRSLGGAELMVSSDTGPAIGVRTDRYMLLRPSPGHGLRSGVLRALLRPLLPDELGKLGRVQVRAERDTPFLRPGDAVLTTAQMKLAFGEFAARPEPGRPGYLDIDPAWVDEQLMAAHVPLLGSVVCHAAVIDALRGAMHELRQRGLGELVETYDGCFAPRFIGRDPTAMISHHSWGIAVDLNIAGNYYGVEPDQDARLIEVMERWGFGWGGRFIVPDGNHFEYHRPPAT